jgi:hypothetical protein
MLERKKSKTNHSTDTPLFDSDEYKEADASISTEEMILKNECDSTPMLPRKTEKKYLEQAWRQVNETPSPPQAVILLAIKEGISLINLRRALTKTNSQKTKENIALLEQIIDNKTLIDVCAIDDQKYNFQQFVREYYLEKMTLVNSTLTEKYLKNEVPSQEQINAFNEICHAFITRADGELSYVQNAYIHQIEALGSALFDQWQSKRSSLTLFGDQYVRSNELQESVNKMSCLIEQYIEHAEGDMSTLIQQPKPIMPIGVLLEIYRDETKKRCVN